MPPPTPGDFLVVALGDSYASGQGAPNENAGWLPWSKPKWDDKRCNRSKHAPTKQAVEMRNDAGDSVGFASVACSGASIEEGLLGPHMGPEPGCDADPLIPQIEALTELAQNLPAGESLDAVTISIGGNDVFFQYVVMACIAFECNITRPLIQLRLDLLPDLLDGLADELKTVPDLSPGEILLVEYPDPTQDKNGHLCNHAPPPPEPFSQISEADSKYAADYVIPTLNHHLCEAARRHEWIWVDGVLPKFHKHGWCAQPQNWVNTVTESMAKQRHHRGAMHPTVDGYTPATEKISDVLAQMVSGTPPSPPTSCPAAPPVPSP